MRVSLINLNLIGQDAIGQSILHQLQFFRRRGDAVQVYTLHPPVGVSASAAAATRVVTPADLTERRDPHFAASDLYVYHYPGYHALMDSMKALEQGAVIFYFHNVTPPALWNRAADVADLQAGVERVRPLAAYADLLVTPSEFNARELIDVHGCDPAKVRVLPLAVPLDHFSPGPPDPALRARYNLEGKRVLLFVGRVASNKRVDLLIEALAQVKQQIPNTALLVVGDNDSNPAFREVMITLRQRIAELGLTEDVLFTGRVDALPPYYRLAELYVTASLHEGFGVPLIEAMASGIPVIASNTTAHPEVVGDAGLLTPPEDASALAAQIVQVLQDDALYGALKQAGLARAKAFTLEKYFARWEIMVAEATAWLPNRPYAYAHLPSLEELTQKKSSNPTAQEPPRPWDDLTLAADLQQLAVAANTMNAGYTVQSRLPILGPLISWLRRNLTSHLREPYIDPTFRRQETFNRLVAETLGLIAVQRSASTDLETRVQSLEATVEQLVQVLALLIEQAQEPSDEQRVVVREQLEQIQASLHKPSDG